MSEPIAKRLSYRTGFPVYLSRYVLFEGATPKAKKRLAMRFFNASEIGITGVRFVLTEKDAAGDEIVTRSLERKGLFAESGAEFGVADVEVDRDCAEVSVRLESVLSDEYEYAVDGDSVRLRYGVSSRKKEVSFSEKATYSAYGKFKKYVLVGLVAILGFAVTAGVLAWQLGFLPDLTRTNGALPERAAAVAEYVEA